MDGLCMERALNGYFRIKLFDGNFYQIQSQNKSIKLSESDSNSSRKLSEISLEDGTYKRKLLYQR